MTTALEPKKETALQPTTGFDRFVEMAIMQKVPVDTLERLLAMQKDIMAANAKAAYDEALSAFQRECPIIHKSKEVKETSGKVRYSYAPMDSIVPQVREPLAKHGFSYDVDTEIVDHNGGNWIKAIVTATHLAGHSKTKTFMVPVEPKAFMNEQQKVAAARTYALRYCFTGIFGIMTGDEDDDTTSIEPAKKETTPTPGSPTTPPTGKPASTPAPQPPAQPDGKLTASGEIANVEDLPMKAKPGKFRYKVTLAGAEKPFYSFDTKVRDLCHTHSTKTANIVYHVGKYGNDIDSLTFEGVPVEGEVLDKYKGELEPKK